MWCGDNWEALGCSVLPQTSLELHHAEPQSRSPCGPETHILLSQIKKIYPLQFLLRVSFLKCAGCSWVESFIFFHLKISYLGALILSVEIWGTGFGDNHFNNIKPHKVSPAYFNFPKSLWSSCSSYYLFWTLSFISQLSKTTHAIFTSISMYCGLSCSREQTKSPHPFGDVRPRETKVNTSRISLAEVCTLQTS